jgi:hypothetical protein
LSSQGACCQCIPEAALALPPPSSLPTQAGSLQLDGRSPQELGVPNWRAQVMYVHQTRVNHRGTPAEFYFACQSFASQRARPRGDLPALIFQLGLEQQVLNQEWSQLSVSRAPRALRA